MKNLKTQEVVLKTTCNNYNIFPEEQKVNSCAKKISRR